MASTGATPLRLHAHIDHFSPIPYYIQIKNIIRDLIEHGEWKAGDSLPSELELCQIFGVSRTVIRQALQELTYEGLLVRERGRGTFVAEPKLSESLVQRLTGFYQDMADRGHPPITQVLMQELVPAGPKIAAYLQVEAGAPLIRLDRLRFVKGEPIVLVSTFLPHHLCPQVMHADFTRQSLYVFLERECGLFIVRGRRFIEAVTANEYEARLLGVTKGAPLLKLESVSYLEDGKPIEYYYAFHRADRSRFEVELVRVKEPVKSTESAALPRSNDLKEE
ncbi:MAG: GntR family transcriptional regulator [Caldilinea sp.]|nr:GntR family transcriptional regulator [Caldilinea sp.]MDW8442085.1 GntR family transcriptional regulator [Caldilineaceae bacterium]